MEEGLGQVHLMLLAIRIVVVVDIVEMRLLAQVDVGAKIRKTRIGALHVCVKKRKKSKPCGRKSCAKCTAHVEQCQRPHSHLQALEPKFACREGS